MAEEIRGLPNDHDAKLQILEVRQGNFFCFPMHLLYTVFFIFDTVFS